nr:MIP/aquaporin family protein [Longirhabdus pacifica]
MSAFWGEVIGTMILIVFGGGVCAAVTLKDSYAQNGGWIVIAFGWGFAVAMGVYAVGEISGAHLNPAVTIGMATVGAFEWENVASYITAQMLGAFLGAALVYLQYLPHWGKTEDPGAKLGVFSTGPAIKNTPANLFSEIFGTFILVLALLFIGANEFTEGLNPLIVGFLIVAIGLSLGGTTGYAINPARDLGPRIAHFVLPIRGKGGSNWSYAWIPILGPIIGGTYGGLFYQIVFEKSSISWVFWALTAVIALITIASFLQDKTSSTSSSISA